MIISSDSTSSHWQLAGTLVSSFLVYNNLENPLFNRERIGSHPTNLLWFISASPPLFFPGPQLWRRRGDSDRMLFLNREERRGTSVTRSFASSSGSPAPPIFPQHSKPAAVEAPVWAASSGLQLQLRPWLPSGLELDGPTLVVSSVEEQETETSLALSPTVTASSFCRHSKTVHQNIEH